MRGAPFHRQSAGIEGLEGISPVSPEKKSSMLQTQTDRHTGRQTCIGVNVESKTCSNVSLYLLCDELKHPTTRPGADVCPQRHGKSVLQTNQKIRRLKLTRTISSKVCKIFI